MHTDTTVLNRTKVTNLLHFGFNIKFYRCVADVRLPSGELVRFTVDLIINDILKPLEHRAWVYDVIERYFTAKAICCLEITDLYGIDELRGRNHVENYGMIMFNLNNKEYMFL